MKKKSNNNNDENQTNGAQDRLKPLFDVLSPKKAYPNEAIDIETDDTNKMDSHLGMLTPMSKAANKLTQLKKSRSKELIISRTSSMKTTSMEIEMEPVPSPTNELKQASTDITDIGDTEVKMSTKISKKGDLNKNMIYLKKKIAIQVWISTVPHQHQKRNQKRHLERHLHRKECR